ncbi:MAG TPA: hypothetical protein PK802_07915 [Candidatus Cloacimonadota bacterium]|nr:hypothetical protein [Acidobacteriota bacterium]HNT17055.1 hypothetical protein [Acidobacteriota bacterium]HPB09595.1 hypothetical protein [Candidatus Cloacimonadota bacterium]HQO21081.1 hypothetical protein [Acidobacteriota bacterium]
MAEISFVIEPNNPSNDHQVRIIVDGQDLIACYCDDMLGIDPPDFFTDRALLEFGKLIFARCSCGVVGCGDAIVHTSRDHITVIWDSFSPKIPGIRSLTFSRQQFDAAVEAARNDHSWETAERTAERFIAELDFTSLNEQGLAFRWASGRLNNTKISVCFYLDLTYQVIVSAPWNHVAVQEAVSGIQAELGKPPYEWSDVTYYPQKKDVPAPALSGPGWRRG